MEIRQATITDLDNVSKIFNKYRQFQGEKSNLSASKNFIEERFKHDESVIFIAEIDAEVVGFAQLYPMFSSVSLTRVFILNDLFVNESARGNGVAKQLLKSIEDFSFTKNVSRITLNVAKTNVNAQALYRDTNWKQDEDYFMFHCLKKM